MKKQMDRFTRRLMAEGILKAFLSGLGAGSIVIILTAFFSWMFAYDAGLYLALGLGGGVLVISAILFYFLKFRPTDTDVAHRVDELGLEERLITMMELEDDDSYIAQRQREDAREHAAMACAKGSGKKIKITVSVALIAVVAAITLVGASMATVTGLAAADVVPYGIELIDPSIEEAKWVTVTYSASEGGSVVGELEQTFLKGGDGTEVYITVEDGYMFTGWSDGSYALTRAETGVEKDLTLVANFALVSGIYDESLGNITPSDKPGVPSSGSDGDTDYNGDFDREDETFGDSTGTGEAGEKAENNVINGSTSLNDAANDAVDNINSSLSGDNDYDSDETNLLDGYKDAIFNP